LAALARQAALQHGNPSARSEESAKAIAADVAKQIRAGADFAAMVEKYSEDTGSKQSGGDFGSITQASSYPEDFKKAVLALEKGQISDPIRQVNGFYVVRCDERSIQPINDVREPITQEIRNNHLNDVLQGLNKRFTPNVLKPDFFSHPQQYLNPAAAAPVNPH
jgi:parvulin-like peptidyl-prolyl isomerase